jgi:hypothetical protein
MLISTRGSSGRRFPFNAKATGCDAADRQS